MTRYLFLLPALMLAACAPTGQGGYAPGMTGITDEVPEGAPEGSCWGKYVSPAVIETVTRQILVAPAKLAEDGSVVTPASYRTETVQEIVEEREETWFERPCADVLTPEFIESLQRALAARELYGGPTTGRMDRRTVNAVRAYQKPLGLDTGILSVDSARKLGLIQVARR
jgi:hypothetical protein